MTSEGVELYEHNVLLRWTKASSTLKQSLMTVCREEDLSVGGVKADLQARLEDKLNSLYSNGDVAGFEHFKESVINARGPILGHKRPHSGTMLTLPSGVTYMHGQPVPPGDHRSQKARTASDGLAFRHSPFYQIRKQLGEIKQCDIMNGAHRNTVAVTINNAVYPELAEVRADPSLKIMVFCAADEQNGARREIAFPHQSGLSVNGNEIKANLRGLKGKPGSTRPVDITKELRLSPSGYSNTVSMTYALTTRKYYLVVYIIKAIQAMDLVKKLETGKKISKETVINEMLTKARDPDIQATSSVLSLKCPLSTLRMDLPCRSIGCRHNQCFDALSFLQLQEQGPTWSCPICSNPAPFESLAVDEYVLDILKSTPKSTEQVTVEPDGKWSQHTRSGGNNSAPSFGSDDDDDDLVEITPLKFSGMNGTHSLINHTPPGSSREASNSLPPPRSASGKAPPPVIDLTLSDDEEEEPVRPPKRQHSSLGALPFTNEPVERPTKRPFPPPTYNTPPSVPTFRSNGQS